MPSNFLSGFVQGVGQGMDERRTRQAAADERRGKYVDSVNLLREKADSDIRVQKELESMKESQLQTKASERAFVTSEYASGKMGRAEAMARLSRIGADITILKNVDDTRFNRFNPSSSNYGLGIKGFDPSVYRPQAETAIPSDMQVTNQDMLPQEQVQEGEAIDMPLPKAPSNTQMEDQIEPLDTEFGSEPTTTIDATTDTTDPAVPSLVAPIEPKSVPNGLAAPNALPNFSGAKSPIGATESNRQDKQSTNAVARVSRIAEVLKDAKPEYFQYSNKVENEINSIRSKAGALLPDWAQLSPEASKYMEKRATFASKIQQDLNAKVFEQAGSAVSAQEMLRQLKANGNLGQGILDGDSYEQFIGKTKAVVELEGLARARAAYAKKNNLDLGIRPEDRLAVVQDEEGKYTIKQGYIPSQPVVSLEQTKEIMKSRLNSIKSEIQTKNPTLSEAQLKEKVKEQFNAEFDQ
jgi:hypothetical protein